MIRAQPLRGRNALCCCVLQHLKPYGLNNHNHFFSFVTITSRMRILRNLLTEIVRLSNFATSPRFGMRPNCKPYYIYIPNVHEDNLGDQCALLPSALQVLWKFFGVFSEPIPAKTGCVPLKKKGEAPPKGKSWRPGQTKSLQNG